MRCVDSDYGVELASSSSSESGEAFEGAGKQAVNEGVMGWLRARLEDAFFSMFYQWDSSVVNVAAPGTMLHFSHPNDTLAWALSFIYILILLVLYTLQQQQSVLPDLPVIERVRCVFGRANWLPGRHDFLHWMVMMSAAVTCAISLPLLMQGLLHMQNLPVFVVFFPLAHVVDSIVFYCLTATENRVKDIHSSQRVTLEIWVVASASLVALYDEYRLTVNGLLFCGFGTVFLGIFRACFVISSNAAAPHEGSQASPAFGHSFITLALVVGLAISGLCSVAVEGSEPLTKLRGLATMTLVSVAAASAVGAVILGASLLAFSPVLARDSFPFHCGIPLPAYQVLPATVASLIVFIVATHSGTVYTSPVQIAAFLLASMSLLGFSTIQLACDHLIDRGRRFCTRSPRLGETAGTHYGLRCGGVFVVCFLLTLITPFTWLLCRGVALALESVDHSVTPHLDMHFRPTHRFDIVISMYDEDPQDVARILSAIQATNYISTLSHRIFIYTKHLDADEASLKSTIGADVVEKLENRGREGGTFLHHILHRWDDLAEQTMFIQAHVHNMREFVPRLNNYLRSNTGMLSLGFAGVLCDCNACSDRWGWSDDYGLVSPTYQQIYNRTCSQALLAYKGQFVASARRIRGTPQFIYKKLYDGITSPGVGWAHDKAIVKGRLDSPSAPFLGFTVERLWSILMQCSEPGIAVKCPSLLSRWRTGGNVEDCQCFDMV
ncbi:hypothetical protein FGG08_000705 [Glutinoglossum americanum]|uniref:Uncharacterized protein n=1 Tax=Glutinoglossum americanum TaxID=1670608 RepID=A0A9P8I3G2_9PEZI|nr:hypothetical protein FGG08_000705 [Glutinoglossum americanum]